MRERERERERACARACLCGCRAFSRAAGSSHRWTPDKLLRTQIALPGPHSCSTHSYMALTFTCVLVCEENRKVSATGTDALSWTSFGLKNVNFRCVLTFRREKLHSTTSATTNYARFAAVKLSRRGVWFVLRSRMCGTVRLQQNPRNPGGLCFACLSFFPAPKTSG